MDESTNHATYNRYPGDEPAAQDQWAPAGDDGGEQYPYPDEGAYGYAPPVPHVPPGGEGQQDWEETAGVASGGRISSSKSRARRRGKKRGRSGGGGSRGDDGFDEVGQDWGGGGEVCRFVGVLLLLGSLSSSL